MKKFSFWLFIHITLVLWLNSNECSAYKTRTHAKIDEVAVEKISEGAPLVFKFGTVKDASVKSALKLGPRILKFPRLPRLTKGNDFYQIKQGTLSTVKFGTVKDARVKKVTKKLDLEFPHHPQLLKEINSYRHIQDHKQWVENKCSGYEPLNKTQIDAKYKIDEESVNKIQQGALSTVKFGTTRDMNEKNVALKLEPKLLKFPRLPHLKKEIEFYKRLHDKYGNLVKLHLVNMVDYGEDDENHVLILERFGKRVDTVRREEHKNGFPWPIVCKIMRHLFIALESLHRADIIHGDLNIGNLAFGAEPEPAEGETRKEDVMYETDVFLFDLGLSTNLRKENANKENTDDDYEYDYSDYSRREDIQAVSRLLLYFLTFEYSLPEIRTFSHLEQSGKGTALDKIIKRINAHPKLKGAPEEEEKKNGLINFYKLLDKLNDCKTEDEVKKAINYDDYRNIFVMTDQGENGKGAKAEDKRFS